MQQKRQAHIKGTCTEASGARTVRSAFPPIFTKSRPFFQSISSCSIFLYGTQDHIIFKQNKYGAKRVIIRPYRQCCKDILKLKANAIAFQDQENSLLSTKTDATFTDFSNYF